MKELGVYIHIPFCIKKCDYCDFISYCDKNSLIEPYMKVVKKELKEEIEKVIHDDYQITTIYIGGGTPSSINAKYIVELMNVINEVINEKENGGLEITIEVNPGTVTEEKLKAYQKAGINRLSIGLQETNNELLKSIGRVHTYEQFLETYTLARSVGFQNINVDLMIGLPEQSIENIKKSLDKIIDLKPEHISVYSLILEEGTKLYKKYQNKIIELPEDEFERHMYWYVKNKLENAGYRHYEISNFARPGFESRHNVNCWKQKEYIGIGLAAHSYIKEKRYSNSSTMEKYLEGEKKEVHETQSKEDKEKEYMLLGLRMIQGVSIQQFKNKFGENPIFLFKNELSKLVEENLVEIDGDKIKLTSKGLDLANLVWEEFV